VKDTQNPRMLLRGLVLLVLAVAPAFSGAQTAVVPPAQAGAGPARIPATEQLDEIEIVGKRLYQIRKRAIEIEDRIYALYNDLNKNDEFDIHCRVEAPTGSRMKQRKCVVALYNNARVEEVQGWLRGDYRPEADMVALQRYPEYRKVSLAVINSNPQLRRLIRERLALEKKYQVAYKERFGGT
jgi:hypothetical protein